MVQCKRRVECSLAAVATYQGAHPRSEFGRHPSAHSRGCQTAGPSWRRAQQIQESGTVPLFAKLRSSLGVMLRPVRGAYVYPERIARFSAQMLMLSATPTATQAHGSLQLWRAVRHYRLLLHHVSATSKRLTSHRKKKTAFTQRGCGSRLRDHPCSADFQGWIQTAAGP